MELKDLIKEYRSIKPDPVGEARSRQMLLNHFRETFPKKTVSYYLYLKPALVSLLVFVFLASSVGTIYAAKSSVPGNLLYPVKRLVEKTKIVFAFNHSQKTVLRAEILTERLSEAKILAKRVEGGDKNSEVELNKMTEDFHNELKVLKDEIASQVSENIPTDENILFDEGSLPIQDNRQVYTVLQSEDLKKLLEETRNSLKENNLVTALEKTIKAEKITQQPVQEEKISPDETTSTPPVSEIKPIIKKSGGSLGAVGREVKKTPPVFKTDMIRESTVGIDIQREIKK